MKTPTHVKIAVVTLLLAVVAAQACPAPYVPSEKQPWESGATTVTLSGGTLRVKGAGAMKNYGDGQIRVEFPPWYNDTSITNVVIEEGVTHIGKMAFIHLRKLSSVTIPASVKSIGESAFAECFSLTSIKTAAGSARYSSVDGVLFNKNKTTLILYPLGKKGAYTIPNGVTAIGGKAFDDCWNLTSVTFPKSVTTIGVYAFSGCNGLTSVSIPGNVKSIKKNAFSGCYNLTTVTIEDGAASIGENAFWHCEELQSVTIPGSVTKIGKEAFDDCRNLASITIAADNPRYSSEDGVFFNKDKTTLILYPPGRAGAYTIPRSVTSVEHVAFYHCSGMVSVNKEDIDAGKPLWRCTGLTSLTSLNPVPPAIKGRREVFDRYMLSYICLYVPKGSVAAYSAAEGWKDFKCIKDLETAPGGE